MLIWLSKFIRFLHWNTFFFVRRECSIIDEASRVSYQDLTKNDNTTNHVEHETMDVENDTIEVEPDPTNTGNDLIDVEQDLTITDNDTIDVEHDPFDVEYYTTVGSETGPMDYRTNLNCSKIRSIVDNDPNIRMSVDTKRRAKNKAKRNDHENARTSRPTRMKTLSACLTLFALFKNPSKLFQEPAMRQIYLTLLTQKDGEIQKLAIACLMPYKFVYLVPYKENIDRLMEDKTFRDELMCFSSDGDSNVVISEHRTDFIHILIRYVSFRRYRGVPSQTRADGVT